MIKVVRVTENTKDEVKCDCCPLTKKQSVDFYEIHLGDEKASDQKEVLIKMCDVCLDKLFSAALSGIVEMNGRVKSSRDLNIISRRGSALRLNEDFRKKLEEERDERKSKLSPEKDEDPWAGIEDEEDEE